MPSTERLREHPHQRLSLPSQLIDLDLSAAQLAAEAHAPVEGHRQATIFRHGPVTAVLFLFEPGGVLKEHQTDGVVTIHVLAGRLEVTVDGLPHQLATGQLLALAPKVAHTVTAAVASRMLLTISRANA